MTSGTLKSFTYSYDNAGNRTATVTAAGTESYTLDALDRLTAVAYPNGDTTSYAYDAAGNRTSKTTNGTTTAYTYDNAGQLTSDGTTAYAYDAAGNLTTAGSNTYSWDWANRLTAATSGGTTTSYAYDGDGVRTQKTTGNASAHYVWDREAGLPQLVDDGATSYLHAGGVQEQVSHSGPFASLLSDGLGSVRGLADSGGALAGSTDYDVFGGVRASSGMASAFGFTGEQTDVETDFSYLRARQYNPVLGRFLSADSVRPNAPGTQGYNAYAYGANNPTRWTDPSGHSIAIVGSVSVVAFLTSCAETPLCAATLAEAFYLAAGTVLVAALVVELYVLVAVIACALNTGYGLELQGSLLTGYHTYGCTQKVQVHLAAVATQGSAGACAAAPKNPSIPLPERGPGVQLGEQTDPCKPEIAGPTCNPLPVGPGQCDDDPEEPPCEPHAIENTPRAPGTQRHHTYPRFGSRGYLIFGPADIPIDDCTLELPVEVHRDVTYGWTGLPGCGPWNRMWEDFLSTTVVSRATRHQVIQFMYDLVRRCIPPQFQPPNNPFTW